MVTHLRVGMPTALPPTFFAEKRFLYGSSMVVRRSSSITHAFSRRALNARNFNARMLPFCSTAACAKTRGGVARLAAFCLPHVLLPLQRLHTATGGMYAQRRAQRLPNMPLTESPDDAL